MRPSKLVKRFAMLMVALPAAGEDAAAHRPGPFDAPSDIDIERLSDHPEHLPTLRAWFEQEWPDYYGADGRGDAAVDLDAYARARGLPVGLVALSGDTLCGFAALRADSIPSRSHLRPWATAGLVPPGLRRRGIGAKLLAGVERLALGMRFERIYCATSTSAGLLERNGWRLMEYIDHDRARVAIFERTLIDDQAPGVA